MPSDHRRAKLACPSRPSFLFREQRMPSKRELTPPLCTLNQPLPFANFCFLKKKKNKPATDPGLSGSERPRLQDRGNGSSIAEGRAPPGVLALFAPLSYVFGWDCGCAGTGVVLSREPAGWRRSPKVPGGHAPRGAACAGRPGSRGTDGDWEHGPGVTCDAAGSPARLTRDIYYYIIILFFFVRQYCAFSFFFFFFSFGGKK